jgi:nucleotide-binding universal stress UspA family protein
LLLGSVASTIAHHAAVPTLLVGAKDGIERTG